MTITETYSRLCAGCGAPNLGTRFCENCGRAAEVSTVEQAPSAAASPWWWRLALGGYALIYLTPMIADLLGFWNLHPLTTTVPAAITAVLAGVAVVAARTTRKRHGVGLALVVVALVGMVLPAALGGGALSLVIFFAMPVAALLLLSAWITTTNKPVRAFWGLAVAVGFGAIAVVISFGTYWFGAPAWAVAGVGAVLITRVLSRGHAPGEALGAASGAVPAVDRTNTLALLSLIFALLSGSVVAIVLGHVAHSQIKRTGERGYGMATAGLVLGYIWLVVVIGLLVWYFTWATSLFTGFY